MIKIIITAVIELAVVALFAHLWREVRKALSIKTRIYLGILIFAVLFIGNWVLDGQLWNQQTELDKEEMELVLANWLYKDGWEIKSIPKSNLHFQILSSSNDYSVRIFRSFNNEDYIYIGSIWHIEEKYYPILVQMSVKNRESMLSQMRIKCSELLNFEGIEWPLRIIAAEIRVPYDTNISRADFLEKVYELRNMEIALGQIMRNAIIESGLTPPS